jgi:hypothetical protein
LRLLQLEHEQVGKFGREEFRKVLGHGYPAFEERLNVSGLAHAVRSLGTIKLQALSFAGSRNF